MGSDQAALDRQQQLEEQGLLTIAIRPPTVPEGIEASSGAAPGFAGGKLQHPGRCPGEPMKQIIAMHGWAGSPCTWSHWQDVFEAKGWIWCNANRGSDGSTPEQPNWSIDAQRRVLIAHSLGWHLIDEELAQATELILLASFGRFIPEGRPGRRLQTGLEGMFRPGALWHAGALHGPGGPAPSVLGIAAEQVAADGHQQHSSW